MIPAASALPRWRHWQAADDRPGRAKLVTADKWRRAAVTGICPHGAVSAWGEILTIRQHGGYLRPGETITIRSRPAARPWSANSDIC